MASFQKNPITKFSRVKNDLAELQRWWPVNIRDDGTLGITVDPVLFKTDFGTQIMNRTDGEAEVAGVRVEAINDDGTSLAGTEPTITISGSGTFSPVCTVNHTDGTTTKFMLVAPSLKITSGPVSNGVWTDINATGTDGLTMLSGAGDGTGVNAGKVHLPMNLSESGKTNRDGPYPIFMTVQEFVEMIDTYRHVGNVDSDKPAWIPHRQEPQTVDYEMSSPAFPDITADPRTPVVGTDAFPTTSPYRATVFMPMMLDNNQMAIQAGGSTLWGTAGGSMTAGQWNKNGITRYNQSPLISPLVVYKRVGTSGDHQENLNISLTQDEDLNRAAIYTSSDTTESPSPKYRMAMALACFLKDGTYSLNDGVLIPYSYDASRDIGGVNTNTLYTTWDGLKGYGDFVTTEEWQKTSAGVYPLFDFVQGPITPRAQGSNWTQAVLSDHIQANAPLRYEVPPNAKESPVTGIEMAVGVVDGAGTQADPNRTNTYLKVTVLAEATFSASGATDPQHVPFTIGDSFYLKGVTGELGTEGTVSNGKIWPTRYSSRRKLLLGDDLDCNGWWKVSKVTTIPVGSDSAVTYWCILNPKWDLPAVTAYVPSDAKILAGRTGGPEYKYNTKFFDYVMSDASNSHTIASIEDGMGATWNDYQITDPNAPDNFQTEPPVSNQSWPALSKIGTGYQAGMNQGDNNVPPASSSNDTYPARPTLGQVGFKDTFGKYLPTRIIPRGIAIQTIGTDYVKGIDPDISKGNGSLRIPSPLGHDLSTRYNNVSVRGAISVSEAGNLSETDALVNIGQSSWRVRTDMPLEPEQKGLFDRDKWAWRGVSTPLWSFMDSETGNHAWDYIKPTGVTGIWTHGRNRPWPAHERMGTRLSMSPSLLPTGVGSDAGWVNGGIETNNMGMSEIGCSPIHLDIELGLFIPNKSNRMSIIEFDMNDADSELGRHHMIYGTNNRDKGFGFQPLWNGNEAGTYQIDSIYMDASGSALVPQPPLTGTTLATVRDAIDRTLAAVSGGNVAFSNFAFKSGSANQPQKDTATTEPFPKGGTANRPAIWFSGAAPHFTTPVDSVAIWQGTEGFALPAQGGFGRMGTGFGQGASFTYNEGFNTVRSTFTDGGMSLSFNGIAVGTDESAAEPVWAFQIKSCAVSASRDRRPYWLKMGSTTMPVEYSLLSNEEPVVVGKNVTNIHDDPFAVYRTGTDRSYFHQPAVETLLGLMDTYFPEQFPEGLSRGKDSAGYLLAPDNPMIQTSNVDLQVDSMTLRHIPTPAMLPFTVDTIAQRAPDGVSGYITLARYTQLVIEAENIEPDKRNFITVSLFNPPSSTTIAKEATSPITGFQDLDPEFLGGVGAVDLTGLPSNIRETGFVVRFNFYVPDTTYPELHPIDWRKTPIIRSYRVFYDHRPTADATIVGNTYDGSTATTVGLPFGSSPVGFNSKVGHIVSLKMAGTTTDPDRKIAKLRAFWGDGTDTDWIDIVTPASTVDYDVSHVYSTRPSSPFKYDIIVYAMDDAGNISFPSVTVQALINAAEPVAILRAVPSMVRAGQVIRMDGSDSYTIDTDTTLSAYTWTFGDGSSQVVGSTVNQDHTYAIAGEYMATLIVTDSIGTVSPSAKAVVKVLPATLVVPLTLSTKPTSFTRTRSANLASTPILDAVYPEVSDMGTRGDVFSLSGMFLQATQETDIAFMEELLLSGALVEFEYRAVNFVGTADSKTFTGRMTSFDYNRQGGSNDRTPYSATFIREAGLGA